MTAIVITNEHGVIVEWGHPAAALFGFAASEMVGTSVSKLIGDETMTIEEIIAPAPQSNDDRHDVELLATRKDASVFQCELSSSQFRAGERVHWVLVFRDVAERSRALLAQQHNEERWRALAMHAPVGILETDASGLCTFVNRRWTEITGIPADEAMGRGWAVAVHPEDAERARVAFREAIAEGGGAFEVDTRYTSRGGKTAWVQGATVPMRDAYGVITGWMASMVDVTERRRALEALANSEANFRSLVERAPFGVLVTHLGTVAYANDTYLAMVGYENASQLVGRSAIELLVHPENRAIAVDRARLRETGADLPALTVRVLRRDGSEFFAESTSTSLLFDGLPCQVFVVRDVTDRERAEQVRLLAERATRESLREKEMLLKEIHHRVKNNLQVIVSLINLQASKLEDPGTRAAFEETRSRVHAIALLHERLYGAKNLGRIDMRDYLRGLASDLSSTNVGASQIQLHVVAEDLYFEMDSAVPIGLIVNELVTNSYKHAFPTPRERGGNVKVELRREGTEIAIVVSDDGIGYPDGLDADAVDSLGLMLISSLSQQLEGSATFESRAEGARCVVRFPAKTAHGSAPTIE